MTDVGNNLQQASPGEYGGGCTWDSEQTSLFRTFYTRLENGTMRAVTRRFSIPPEIDPTIPVPRVEDFYLIQVVGQTTTPPPPPITSRRRAASSSSLPPLRLITPLPTGTPLEQMRAAGEIDNATEDPSDLPEPLMLPPGIAVPSTTLHSLRRDER